MKILKKIQTFYISVALNYQTDDKENLLNRAMFAGNGGSGYILKPRFQQLENYSLY